jgi:hypothetical protein
MFIIAITIAITCICESSLPNINDILNTKLVEVPVGIKCRFEEPDCMEGDIDGWSICYGIVYFIVGLLYPNYYLNIAIFAVGVEIGSHFIIGKSRYIMHPLIALTTYSIGSLISLSKYNR